MELIPKEIKEQIPSLYATEDQTNPIVFVKLFLDSWTWFITELSIDEDMAFGYVVSPFSSGELGYISLNELKSLRGSLGTWVQRDLYFTPVSLSEVKKESN